MAVGWSRDGAVQEQIDATVESAVQLARSRLPNGESSTHCEECGEAIPERAARQCPEFDIVSNANQTSKNRRRQSPYTTEAVIRIVN